MELELEKNLKILTEGIEVKTNKFFTYEDILDLLKKVYRKQVKRYHPDQVNFSGLTLEELRKKYDAISNAYYRLIELINQDKDNFIKIFNRKYFNSDATNKTNKDYYTKTLDDFSSLTNLKYSFKIFKFISNAMLIDVYSSTGDLYKSFTISQVKDNVLGKDIFRYFISINANDMEDYIYQATLFSGTNIFDIIRFYDSSYSDDKSKQCAYKGLELLVDNVIDPDTLMDLCWNNYGYLGDFVLDSDKFDVSLVYSERNQELIKNSSFIQDYLKFVVKDWKGREINTKYTRHRK